MIDALWAAFDEAVANLGVAGASLVLHPSEEPVTHWQPVTLREPAFLAYSITKTFIATCVLRQCEIGVMSLETPLGQWCPEVPGAERISIRQLLNHTSGIPDYGHLENYHEAVKAFPSSPWVFEKYASETAGRGLAFEPGEGWLYSNAGYMLLRAVLERVSRLPFSELLARVIFRPLRLNHSFVPDTVEALQSLVPAMTTALSTDGTVRDTRLHYHPGWVSHGVVASTPSDIVRFFDALFAGRLLSSNSLSEMTKLVPVPNHLAPGYTGKPSYGLGLMGDPTTPLGPSWGHDGGGPGYQASVRHRAGLGATVCVMAAIEQRFSAADVVSHLLNMLAKGR